MAVKLNHTIVWSRDKRESATFVSEILGLPPPTSFAHFLCVQVANEVTLDFGQYDHFLKNLAIAGGLIQVWAFGSGGLAITHSRPRTV